MQFVLYSEKSVAECLTEINARMQVKATSTRPALDGWIEKSGTFSISMSAPVMGRFARRTALRAKVSRENGITVIRGSVPGGVAREQQIVVFVALAVVALTVIGSGNVFVGLMLLPLAALLYIPMQGDHLNSAVLIDEVQKALKAKPTLPKTPPSKSTSESRTAKATPSRTASAKPKPAATRANTSKSNAKRSKTAKSRTPSAKPEKPAASRSKAAKSTGKTTRAAAPRPKKPSTPPASEFPELPDEAPPS